MTARAQTIDRLARQLATFTGQIFDRVSDKRRAELRTMAATMVATVERGQSRHEWPRADGYIGDLKIPRDGQI